MVVNNLGERSGKIKVADITLFQLSRGLYRSTACAFKELVNNSFDAYATEVRIYTNFPGFDFISCVDNGKGMSLEEFKGYFDEEGVGTCLKRKGGERYTEGKGFKRPIIGKLGIGMMSIGQICHSFEIESHYVRDGKPSAYKAEVVLEDVDLPLPEEVERDPKFDARHIDVGTWSLGDPIEFDEKKIGFRIYSTDVRDTFRREMETGLKSMGSERKKLSFSLAELHKQFFDKKNSIRECTPYLETIWELETLCPIPYRTDNGRFPVNVERFKEGAKKTTEFAKAMDFLERRQKQLLGYKFKVVFDGINLKRSIQLPTEKKEGIYPKLYFVDFDEVVYTDRLKFSGYVFAQVQKALIPRELSGLQIRLRDVGIGGYDNTFLKYYKTVETIRGRWISGEIFVDCGLEDALNIDRDSFNEHDEHYKKLQEFIHDKINKVFNEVTALAKGRSESKRSRLSTSIKNRLEDITEEYTSGKLTLKQKRLGKTDPAVKVDASKNEVILNTDAEPIGKKRADYVIRIVMLALAISKKSSGSIVEKESKSEEILKRL